MNKMKIPYGVTDNGIIEYSETLSKNLLLAATGQKIPNRWASGYLRSEEVLKDSSQYILWLLDIITRLKGHIEPCSKCGGVGSYMERMGGCRDDNESVICSACKGRIA